MDKTCFKCHAVKPRSEFYAHKQMGDGLLGKCKDCTKADSHSRFQRKLQDVEWRIGEMERQRIKEARRRSDGLTQQVPMSTKRIQIRNYRLRYPEKFNAHQQVAKALKQGKLKRKPCFCGAKAEAHHDDYSKPLDVRWLCKKHHMEAHVEIRKAALLAAIQQT